MTERRSPLLQPWGLDAIRRGDKTQTRRVMKPQPPDWVEQFAMWPPSWPLPQEEGCRMVLSYGGEDYAPKLPHGQPGDVWALREPLYRAKCDVAGYGDAAMYGDAWPVKDRRMGKAMKWQKANGEPYKRDTLTSMYMPLWAARDFVTVSGVRAEWLQDISEADCFAEGIKDVSGAYRAFHRREGWTEERLAAIAIANYKAVWDSINGKKHPWKSNPWVWCYTFGDYIREPGRPMQGTEAASG